VVRVVDIATDPSLLGELLSGALNQLSCQHCKKIVSSDTPVYLHDSQEQRYLCVYPSAWRSRELALRVEFYQELLGIENENVPGYVREARFVFGLDACAKIFAGAQKPTETEHANHAETTKVSDDQSHAHELKESDFEQVFDEDWVDRRDSALVQHWQESGQDYYHFMDQDVLHIFQRHGAPERFGDRADVFFQLHRIENFPLIVLLLVAESTEGGNEVLYWLFNLDNRIDVKFVERLAENFEVNLHLFDESYTRKRSMVFSPALQRNVAYVLEEARKWLDQIDPKRRNFFIAASKFDETAYRKLGRGRPGLDRHGFRDLPTPSLTKLALDILNYWSLRENYEYLIFIKSFPVESFKHVLTDVLARAIEFGVAMSEKMKRIAVEMELAVSKEELISRLLDNFRQVVLGQKENDMDLASQWENWRKLLTDAQKMGMDVEPEVAELAKATRRKMDEEPKGIPLDLSDDVEMLSALDQLDPEELLDLLKDSDQRLEAVRTISQLNRQDLMEQAFQAFSRMTRREIDSLADAMAGFGSDARDTLYEFARGDRSAQAVGAMRALVKLEGHQLTPILLQAVESGRRGVWREAVDMLIDMPDLPLEAILKASRNPDAKVRGRVLQVLAGQTGSQVRVRLEEMAKDDPDSSVRRDALNARKLR